MRVRDPESSAVTSWVIWLAAVLMLGGAVLLLAGWTWAGAVAVVGAAGCVALVVVQVRSDR
jgi:hypothetical protein